MSSELSSRPYVISWNLTYRCNLACEHCYLDAGAKKKQKLNVLAFADRSELETEECFRVIDQICAFAPEAVTILTGGEPLLRDDIIDIIKYGSAKKLWVVVGTNGVFITPELSNILKSSGVRGMALSLDSLDADLHDKFRGVKGAWKNTVAGAQILSESNMPFIVQTTVGKHNCSQLEALADFAYSELSAKVWNLYFMVQTGRGQFVSDLTKEEYQTVLGELYKIQKKYLQKMLVNAKCAPHYITTLLRNDPSSPFLKTYSDNAGGCPAGTHYMGIRPNGDMTPCPYLPVFGGNIKEESFSEIWNSSLFQEIRNRNSLGGKCGACELSSLCGGCRARAYGITGNYLEEDPLCSYSPGELQESLVTLKSKVTIEYGLEDAEGLAWDDEARERMNRIPRFVRGMVIKAVEKSCRSQGILRVTPQILEEIRARMPTPKMFRT